MNSETFKPYLVRDKVFLNELYQSSSVPNSKRLLLFAADQKLDTLKNNILTNSAKLKLL